MMNDLQDDPSLPAETHVYFSVFSAVFGIIFSIIFLTIAVFFAFQKIYLFAIIIGSLAIFFIYRFIAKISNRSPQLTLSDEGIETAKYGFVSWKEISSENMIYRQRAYNFNSWIKLLEYTGSSGSVQVDITDLHVKKSALEHMLQIYRLRYNMKE